MWRFASKIFCAVNTEGAVLPKKCELVYPRTVDLWNESEHWGK